MRVVLIVIACAAICVLAIISPVLADTLDKIKSSGVILLGYWRDAPPFSSIASGGQPEGFSIDLCDRVVAEVKIALKIDKLGDNFGQYFITIKMSVWPLAPCAATSTSGMNRPIESATKGGALVMM